jgi:Uma2 family endonuclease
MQTPVKKRQYTIDEYLAIDKQSQSKNEYVDGEILAMTGGTTNHNLIAGNFYIYLRVNMRGKKTAIFINDVRLWIARYQVYTYPDVMVMQNTPVYEGDNKTTVINPVLIVEVLSKSTKNYDQGDKFDFYRSIPDLQEYIMIDQYKYFVKQFTKNSQNQWVLTDYESIDDILQLSSINLSVPLQNIYEEVDFTLLDSE